MKRPKRLTVNEMMRNMKVMNVMAKIKKTDTPTLETSFFNRIRPQRYRTRLSGLSIRGAVEILYRDYCIKDVFPKITKETLKTTLKELCAKREERHDRKRDRERLFALIRTKRLLPLSDEKYFEFGNRTPNHKRAVLVALTISERGYYSFPGWVFREPFGSWYDDPMLPFESKKLKDALFHRDEKPYAKITDYKKEKKKCKTKN